MDKNTTCHRAYISRQGKQMINKMGLRHLIARRKYCKCNRSAQQMGFISKGQCLCSMWFYKGGLLLWSPQFRSCSGFLKQKPLCQVPRVDQSQEDWFMFLIAKGLIHEPECHFINLTKCRTTRQTEIQTSLFRYAPFL